MSVPAGSEPLEFNYFTADSLGNTCRAAATAIVGQYGPRALNVSTAKQEFRGFFSELFDANATTARVGAQGLVEALRAIADASDTLKEAARKEDDRRRQAREWAEEQENRHLGERIIDSFTGGEEMPRFGNEPAPTFPAMTATPGSRETPAPGAGGGGGGGTSSARPEDLRSFAAGIRSFDDELSDRPGAVRGKLADFAAQCKWGTIDGDGVVTAFETWLSDNDGDASWATTIADAFANVGAENTVSTLSDAGLLAALQAAGVSAARDGLVIDPPRAYGVPPTTGFTMDPINTSTGNFLEVEHDLGFAGASASLRVSRTYNSLDEHVGVFGPGWASTLDVRLALDDEGAAVVLEDGRQQWFPRQGSGWDRAAGENAWFDRVDGDLRQTLRALPAEAVFVVRDNAGAWRAFSVSGSWVGSGGGPGTTVLVERDVDGLVSRLVHERGRWVSVEYADGLVAVLAGSDGRRVEYAYDDARRLVAATTEIGTRRYRWNDQGLIEAVVSAAAVVEAENVYDGQGRVVRQVTPHGRTARFGYLPGRVTVVSDEDGTRSNSYIADPKGRLVGVLDADDRRQSMSYDAHGNLVSVIERDGSTTVHGYDARGRRVRTVTPSGADLTYGWDEQDRITTLVTESGAIVSYEYASDADRDPSVIVDPEGGRTELVWHEGLLQRATDPTGVVVTCRYDAHGDLVETENAVGDVARIERDHVGRPVAATSPSGARTTFGYDAAGLLVSRRDADGAVWRFEHGADGRVSAIVDPVGARTELTYGAHGELETTTDPLGRQVSREFDDQGDVSQLVLPDGGAWAFAHDALSRLVRVTDPAGGVWSREHDATGALTAVVDPTGVRAEATIDRGTGTTTIKDAFEATTVRFDEFGRPVSTTTPDGTAELTTYDRCGRPVELVDGEGGLTRLERDPAGRVTAIVAPSGATTRYEYDACGRPSAAVDALGARTTLTYDADSRVVARTLPTGEVERSTYDPVGRLLSSITPGAGTSRFRYDAAGRLTGLQDARFGRRAFRYDTAGQLVEAVDGLGGVTRYEYDVRGRVVSITDPAGGTTHRTYDAADRVTAVTDPLGRTTTATYDAAGRQLFQTDPEGKVTSWAFDAAGRGTGISVDGRPLSTITRDAFSRTLVVTDHTRGEGRDVEHELAYDRRGLLVRRSRGDQAVSWEYDADGHRTARTDPAGTRTTYRRDAAGRLTAVERDGLGTGTFRWDAAGRIVESATGDLVQSWTYEGGALVAHTTTTPDGVSATRIGRDDDDRITRLDDGTGTTTYVHDDAAQLVRVQGADGRSRAFEYDTAGRLTRETVDGVVTTHEYDTAGQLVASTVGGARTEYVHDGLGRRVRRTTTDGSSTEYAWNDLGYLAAVIDRDASSQVTGRVEVWVDALGELASIGGTETWWDTAAPVPTLISVDDTPLLGLPGGVTAVGDAWSTPGWRAARATDASDPWAVLGQVAGPALPQGVGLTAGGGITVAGLEWMGARVYDPAARGFLSTDPLAPVTGAAWAGNPYSYAGNDPLHTLDPLGLRPATDADLDAYAHANQGAFAAVGEWVSEHKEEIVAGLAIAAAVGLMFVPGGPLLSIGLMAASGALLSGGVSVLSQKAETGQVDWGKVAVDTVIGGMSGAVGGGAASAAAKFGPGVTRAATPLVQRISSPAAQRAATSVIRSSGRAAFASGMEGATGNTLDYHVHTPNDERSISGYANSLGVGFGTGVGGSLASRGLSNTVISKLELTPVSTSGLRPRSMDPHATLTTNIISGGVDRAVGAASGAVNEAIRPGGENAGWASVTGSLTGATGPTFGIHATR